MAIDKLAVREAGFPEDATIMEHLQYEMFNYYHNFL